MVLVVVVVDAVVAVVAVASATRTCYVEVDFLINKSLI